MYFYEVNCFRWNFKGGWEWEEGNILSRVFLLSLVLLGIGVYEGGFRYELRIRKCNVMCRVMF